MIADFAIRFRYLDGNTYAISAVECEDDALMEYAPWILYGVAHNVCGREAGFFEELVTRLSLFDKKQLGLWKEREAS